MSREHEELPHRWFEEVWNQGRTETIRELLAEDARVHGIAPEPLVGPKGFEPFHLEMRQAFEIQAKVDEVLSAGSKLAFRWSAHMTHKGEVFGVAATRKRIHVTGMVLFEIRDGQIQEAWNNWDLLHMLSELGAVDTSRLH